MLVILRWHLQHKVQTSGMKLHFYLWKVNHSAGWRLKKQEGFGFKVSCVHKHHVDSAASGSSQRLHEFQIHIRVFLQSESEVMQRYVCSAAFSSWRRRRCGREQAGRAGLSAGGHDQPSKHLLTCDPEPFWTLPARSRSDGGLQKQNDGSRTRSRSTNTEKLEYSGFCETFWSSFLRSSFGKASPSQFDLRVNLRSSKNKPGAGSLTRTSEEAELALRYYKNTLINKSVWLFGAKIQMKFVFEGVAAGAAEKVFTEEDSGDDGGKHLQKETIGRTNLMTAWDGGTAVRILNRSHKQTHECFLLFTDFYRNESKKTRKMCLMYRTMKFKGRAPYRTDSSSVWTSTSGKF